MKSVTFHSYEAFEDFFCFLCYLKKKVKLKEMYSIFGREAASCQVAVSALLRECSYPKWRWRLCHCALSGISTFLQRYLVGITLVRSPPPRRQTLQKLINDRKLIGSRLIALLWLETITISDVQQLYFHNCLDFIPGISGVLLITYVIWKRLGR